MPDRNLICIICPMGCNLSVDISEDGSVKGVSGNNCNRGITYAEREITNPTRTLTTTVPIIGGIHPVIPVRTNGEIPKRLIPEVMKLLENVHLHAPVKCGEVVIRNVLNTGVDIVTSRSM